jgi:hypothetical protein
LQSVATDSTPVSRLCRQPLHRALVDLGMSSLCESFVPADKLDGVEPYYPLHGEELVLEPLDSQIEGGDLMAYKYEGFGRVMDTLPDRLVLEETVERGETPWRVQPVPLDSILVSVKS